MKATVVTMILACTLLLSLAGTGRAGICIYQDSFCNDFFVAFSNVESNVYELHGYENGCGYFDRLVHGAIHLAGGYAYYGLTLGYGSSCGADNGCGGSWAAVIALSNGEGTGYWNFYYTSGGVRSGHSTSDTVDSAFCTDPALILSGTRTDAAVAEQRVE
jgi:hypothetical protein